jgi:hypothetical protein
MITAEKILKGCGIEFDYVNPTLYRNKKCNKREHCTICQARISQYKEDLQQELEFLEGLITICNEDIMGFRLVTRRSFIKSELEIIGK